MSEPVAEPGTRQAARSQGLRAPLRDLPAGWRDDSVAAQVDHHLPVVVEAMRSNNPRQFQAAGGAIAERPLHRIKKIFFGHASDRLVSVLKRGFQKFDDVSFGGDRLGPGLTADIDGRFLLKDRRAENIVDGGNMLHLLRESANALELAGGRDKTVFVFGHSLRG